MAEARPILDHHDQLERLDLSARTAQDDPVVAVKRIGQDLRHARELKGAQLGDVSRAVNIHPNYLAAIEDGRFEDLPSRAFTIGYVARYGRYLGLDVENVVDRLEGEIAPGDGPIDDPIDISPLTERSLRLAVIAVALLLLAAVTYSADDIVAFVTRPSGQIVADDPAQEAVDAPAPADKQTLILPAPSVPPPTRIAVTPPVSLRADLTPAAIERARIAAIPLEPRIAVTPPASLRADLTPAAIRQETRVAALFPMPLPAGIAVTPRASLSADLMPAAVREEIRIARIPVPTQIGITPPHRRALT